MKINPIISYSFKSSLKSKPASNTTKAIPIDGYKTEFYNQDGSFKESVELKYTNEGRFFILNEDKEGKNSCSMSIPYELYPMSFFSGAVNPLKFCYLTQIKDGKENLRILIGKDRVLSLYYDDNGLPKESKITNEELMKFKHLVELAKVLPSIPYGYFDAAIISLNTLEKHSNFDE